MTHAPALKILFVGNYGSAKARDGCAGIFVERQARSLRNLSVVVELFDIGAGHSVPALLGSWRRLRRAARETRPDLLHAQYGTIVALVSVLTLHPTVITFGGSDLLPGASISLPRTWGGIVLSNVASLLARRIICVSEQLKTALWWRRSGVVVIPRGVDLELFTPGPRDDARRQLGWDLDKPAVLVDGGRDWRNKGLDVVERAVLLAREEVPGLELKVIKDVSPDQMPVWYRAADVLVCASRQEGSPNVVKESLACNLPVVGVDVGDVRERLASVEPSALVERTSEAIARAIVGVIRDGRRSNGRERVSEIAQEVVARRIVDVYSRALGARPSLGRGRRLVIEPIREDLLPQLVDVHMDAFEGYMNASIGRAYVRAFLSWFSRRSDGIALGALVDGCAVGYVVGAPIGYERSMNRDLLWAAARGLALRPWLVLQTRFTTRIAQRARQLLGSSAVRRPSVRSLPQPVMSLVGIGVSAEGRGSGTGRELMQEFERRCRAGQMRAMRLSVYASNEAARTLYDRAGWTLFVPEEGGDAVYYYRILDPDPS